MLLKACYLMVTKKVLSLQSLNHVDGAGQPETPRGPFGKQTNKRHDLLFHPSCSFTSLSLILETEAERKSRSLTR